MCSSDLISYQLNRIRVYVDGRGCVKMPTVNGIIRVARTLCLSGLVVIAILIIGEIVYILEEKWRKRK